MCTRAQWLAYLHYLCLVLVHVLRKGVGIMPTTFTTLCDGVRTEDTKCKAAMRGPTQACTQKKERACTVGGQHSRRHLLRDRLRRGPGPRIWLRRSTLESHSVGLLEVRIKDIDPSFLQQCFG